MADWIGIGIAAVSIFLGGTVGTVYGAIRRARVDDRRQVFSLLELLENARLGYEDQRWDAYPVHPVDYREWTGHARFARVELEIDKVVLLLPWLDRAMWARLKRSIPDDNPLRLELTLARYWAMVFPTGVQTQEGAAYVAEVVAMGTPTEQLSEWWEPWDKMEERFRSYLLNSINPSSFTRIAILRLRLMRFIRGPRPWNVRLSKYPWPDPSSDPLSERLHYKSGGDN